MDSDRLRPIEAAENAVESVRDAARGALLDWLDHYECDHCGAVCTAETEYVERQADYLPVWKCPEEDCNARFHREEGNPLSAEMWDR